MSAPEKRLLGEKELNAVNGGITTGSCGMTYCGGWNCGPAHGMEIRSIHPFCPWPDPTNACVSDYCSPVSLNVNLCA
ncbi:MAG: hypothetical protein ABIF77_20440 [bacterium]